MNLSLAFAVLMHLAVASFTGLTADEAHYLLYAQFLDWSYFDHPPLVGWIQAPLIALTDSVLIIRLLPQLIWLVCAWLIYRITQDLNQDKRTAFLAVTLFCLSPVLHIHGIALLPDTLLCLFTLLASRLSLRLVKSIGASHKDNERKPNIDLATTDLHKWALLGFLLGLAGLSKYSAVFLAAGLAIFFLALLKGRIPLLGIALATLIGSLVVSPVLFWNATQDWISFRYQGGHVSGGTWRPEMVLGFLVAQCLAFGPITVWGLASFWQRRENLLINARYAWLLATFFVPLLLLAYLAGGGRSLPYWTSPAWVMALPFAAIGLLSTQEQLTTTKSKSVPVLVITFAVTQVTLIGWVTASLILGRPAGLAIGTEQPSSIIQGAQSEVSSPGKASNPFADVHGWEQLGNLVTSVSKETGVNTLAIGNWTLASRLSWYARPLPVWVTDSRFDQFDIWIQKPPIGTPVLFVRWSEMPSAVGSGKINGCKLVDEVNIQHFGKNLSYFSLSICRVAH